MKLSSPAFDHDGKIPEKYTQYGDNVSPPLIIEDIPMDAITLALIMDDPDVPPSAPVPVWDHWIVFNIPPGTGSIPEGEEPRGVHGKGTRDNLNYMGPKPPDREHRYFFKIYALDISLTLPEGSTKKDVEQEMHGHILDEAMLIGRFAPPQSN